MALRIKLYDIHALHAQLANAGAEFEDDRIVTNKLAMIGKILSYEQRLLYLPLLRGLMFEEENVAWCDIAIGLLQVGIETLHSL